MSDQLTDMKTQIEAAAQAGPKVKAALGDAIQVEQQTQNVLGDATAARKKAEVALQSAQLVENQAVDAMAAATAHRQDCEKKVQAVSDSIAGLGKILETLKSLAGNH